MSYPIRQGDIPGVQLRYEKSFALSVERLWPWLTEPRRMVRWLADRVERHPLDEAGWVWHGVDPSGRPFVEEARRLTVDETAGDRRRWIATFERADDGWESATRLVFELSGDGPCRLAVLQQGFERLSLSRCLTDWELYRKRWRLAFDRLEAALAAASGEPDGAGGG